MGPIGGLNARQFNGCLPRREEKRREEKLESSEYQVTQRITGPKYIIIFIIIIIIILFF